MDSTNTHKTLLLSKSHTLLLISKLIHKIREYFIEYSLIAYAKFSQYSPILMFDSQINICQQQRQNMDYVSLTTCKKQILWAALLGFGLWVMMESMTPSSLHENAVVS